ncbi:MAG: carboxypeptidase-like regulatory domain-containing protein, partial [Bacteroidales bacterium]|nr:carboxypeptidase-like regulatory domain-containing protein [Bacteroidales bacterium]
VIVFAIAVMAFGTMACSSGKSDEDTQWATIGKTEPQTSAHKMPPVSKLRLDGTLRGTVKDEEGQPLQGVTVYALIPGDPHVFGMMTDAAGQYEIKVPKKRATEVYFSLLGKEKVTLPIGKKKKIDVVLKDEALELDPGYLDQPAGAFRIVPQNQ